MFQLTPWVCRSVVVLISLPGTAGLPGNSHQIQTTRVTMLGHHGVDRPPPGVGHQLPSSPPPLCAALPPATLPGAQPPTPKAAFPATGRGLLSLPRRSQGEEYGNLSPLQGGAQQAPHLGRTGRAPISISIRDVQIACVCSPHLPSAAHSFYP